MEKSRWIFDEEVYPNLFLLCAKIPGTDIRRRFQVSPIGDNRNELASWLLNEVDNMVGFNNLFYDYPVLHHVFDKKVLNLRGRDFCNTVYKFSSNLIKSNRFPKRIYPLRKQIDLFKINHFDNKAKMTSLKLLEFNLRLKNIQELPYPPDMILSESQIQDIVDYCDNDTDATELVYDETLPEIELRDKMSPMFGIDFTNFNSSKMGEHILISKIVEQLGEDKVYYYFEGSSGAMRKKIINTPRESIDFQEVVFDYIDFKTEPFQKILQWFKGRTITETKGVFSEIPFDELEILEPHYHIQKTKGVQKTLNVVNFDFQYDFGVGGIHGSVDAGVYEPSEGEEILDIDVASYYPNLAIKNRFYPQHLGVEFCDIYESIYEERKKYPKKTHKMENLALKLALNGSYGKSNSEFSPLYDPMYTMKTTVNGQLLLCMLSEQLMLRVPNCMMLQINTDGMTIKFKKVFKPLVTAICKEWEQLTQLELEDIQYSKMIIKDVNNYIAVSLDGNYIKRKGAAFIYKEAPGELEMHKNFSQLIVPKALEAYFVDGILPEDFIKNHDNIYDFFKRTKLPRNYWLLERDYDEYGNVIGEDEIQRITRYIVSGETIYDKDSKLYSNNGCGRTLIKKMPPLKNKKALEKRVKLKEEQKLTDNQVDEIMTRYNNLEAGWLCSTFNHIENEDEIKKLIYYPYYIDEVYKVINVIENNE
jgi:hypothetical protein